ncbi:MAG: hypothetical protein QNL24_14590 [Akkermansiaceae bacterium]
MPSSRAEETNTGVILREGKVLRGSGAGSVTEQERSYLEKVTGSLHLREALELRTLK